LLVQIRNLNLFIKTIQTLNGFSCLGFGFKIFSSALNLAIQKILFITVLC